MSFFPIQTSRKREQRDKLTSINLVLLGAHLKIFLQRVVSKCCPQTAISTPLMCSFLHDWVCVEWRWEKILRLMWLITLGLAYYSFKINSQIFMLSFRMIRVRSFLECFKVGFLYNLCLPLMKDQEFDSVFWRGLPPLEVPFLVLEHELFRD